MGTTRAAKYESTEFSDMNGGQTSSQRGNSEVICFASSTTAKVLFGLALAISVGAGIAIGFIFYPQNEILGDQTYTLPSSSQPIEVQSDTSSEDVIFVEEATITATSSTAGTTTATTTSPASILADGGNEDSSERNRITGNLVDYRQRKIVGINSNNCGKISSVTASSLKQRSSLDKLISTLRSESNHSRKINFNRHERIVGGREVTIKSHPWQVALWTSRGHTCGGSLISSNWVLSAAHCTVVFDKPEDWLIYLGETKRTNLGKLYSEEGLQHIAASHVVSHEQFNQNTYDNDVSLIRLAQHVVLNEYTNTICLPPQTAHLPNGTKCVVSGWGVTVEGGSTPDKLQEASVDIIDRPICNKEDWLMDMVSDRMVCAGTIDGSQDACQGDSGGPLVCLLPNSENFYLVGAVSWGIGCGVPFMPGVYTDLRKYGGWISSTMKSIDSYMQR